MLPRHFADAHVGSDHDHGVVGHETDESEHSSLEVLLMATQIQERDQTLRVLRDVRPGLILTCILMRLKHLVVLCVEAHDFLPNARGSSVCRFVTEVKHFLAR